MYQRSTREVEIDKLPAPLREGLASYARAHQLELQGCRCWLTHSVNPASDTFFGKLLGRRANPVDPDAAHDTAVLLHKTHVIVATAGDERGVAVLAVPLEHASIQRGSVAGARLGIAVPEASDGFTLSGLPGTEGRVGTYFVGLGTEPAAAECFDAVEAAIRARKNQG